MGPLNPLGLLTQQATTPISVPGTTNKLVTHSSKETSSPIEQLQLDPHSPTQKLKTPLMSIHSPTTLTKQFASSLSIASPPSSHRYPTRVSRNQPPNLYLNLASEVDTKLSPAIKTTKKKTKQSKTKPKQKVSKKEMDDLEAIRQNDYELSDVLNNSKF